MATNTSHIIVVGGGNAAFSAALAATEAGARVTMLERAPEALRGGNSRFTAGALRTVYRGVEDLRRLMPDLTDDEMARTDFGSYSREQFYEDLGRVTQYRCDPELAETLIESSFDTLCWMQQQGLRFLPLYGRQSFEVDGKVRFWGGLTVEAWGGGPGLIDSWTDIALARGVELHYGARATGLMTGAGGIEGVRFTQNGRQHDLAADAVVLASGGFESNTAWRARYLGPGWDLARVRGTRFNTGDGIDMAVAAGAAVRGHWGGCHAVAWDLNAPEYGDLAVGDNFQKHSYPFGLIVNALGERFVDEGADFRNYTYAKYGREILNQPYMTAWQVFDASVDHLLRDEYRIREVTRVTADTLAELGAKMQEHTASLAPETFAATVEAFNASIATDVPFDPTVKDGRGTRGLNPPKSNWANALSKPPFTAYGVTCGITFTFGGLHVDAQARVIDQAGEPIAGLFAAGELVGGLFYFNYPGGTGLTSGSVFGRIAGRMAAGRDARTR